MVNHLDTVETTTMIELIPKVNCFDGTYADEDPSKVTNLVECGMHNINKQESLKRLTTSEGTSNTTKDIRKRRVEIRRGKKKYLKRGGKSFLNAPTNGFTRSNIVQMEALKYSKKD